MTRVIIAQDSLKGTISAADAAAALAAGWASVEPDARLIPRPMADGGEGTLEAFAAARPDAVRLPLGTGRSGDPFWLLLPPEPGAPRGTAVVELAVTCGIERVGTGRPLDAGTEAFGTAIAAALDHAVSRLVLGIGSSASTDGGAGMLTALGARLLDRAGAPIAAGARGLLDLERVELGGIRDLPETRVLTDVSNPMTGPRGAAEVFGPQKGLVDPAARARVDAAMGRLAALCDLDPATPGTGAAGGVGGALVVLGAELLPGAAEVAGLIGLADAIAGADLVITGEGAFDGQSAAGKAPSHVAALARAAGVPVALVAGRIAADAPLSGFASAVSLTELAGSAERSLAEPDRWLRAAGAELAARRNGRRGAGA